MNAELIVALGYTEWRNFSEAIRRARQQVANHVSADQGSFVDANKSVPTPMGNGRRMVQGSAVARTVAR